MHNNRTDSVTEDLRDPENLDFRPRAGSPLVDAGYRLGPDEVPWKDTAIVGMGSFVGEAPDIGAYEYGSPFGGYKASGNGREGGEMGLEDFLETKMVHGLA